MRFLSTSTMANELLSTRTITEDDDMNTNNANYLAKHKNIAK